MISRMKCICCWWWFLKFFNFDSGWFGCFKIMMMTMLLLMLGLGIVCSLQLHIKSHFITLLLCLIAKWPIISDLWDAMMLTSSCTKCSYLMRHVNCVESDLSDFFYDCICDSKVHFAECEDEAANQIFWDCEEDGIFNAEALREMLKTERQRAEAAILELGKERLAVASAAEEAMAMILRLQNEKSSLQIETHSYKKMAEQKISYQQQTIEYLRVLLLKHQSEKRVLEERLRLCRQKLKLYSHETEVDQFNTTFSDFNCYMSENALLELYS